MREIMFNAKKIIRTEREREGGRERRERRGRVIEARKKEKIQALSFVNIGLSKGAIGAKKFNERPEFRSWGKGEGVKKKRCFRLF